jgi:hypothetical protein
MIRKPICKINYLLILAVILIASCKKKDPSIDDYFLNYTIPEVPVTQDYIVGAFYYPFSTFNTNIQYTPTVGKYAYSNGIAPAGIMQQHIEQAATAKIDYFIYTVNSPTLSTSTYKNDSTAVNTFLTAPNSSKINFAVCYNLNSNTLGISNTVTLESNATKLESFYRDFQRLTYWMTKSNYQKVNGKYLIFINAAQDLNSNMDPNSPGSDVPVYTEIRRRLTAMGFDIYIVGQQNQWTSPQLFYYRFQNCVDAMYETNMADNKGTLDRTYLFGPACDQNFAYWKKMIESWNMEFVPCIQAAYNYQINTPTSTSLSTPRTADGAFYQTYTNVAKRNASKSRLILIDSFNNFSMDTQIESTTAYGSLYLDITRKEFKVN